MAGVEESKVMPSSSEDNLLGLASHNVTQPEISFLFHLLLKRFNFSWNYYKESCSTTESLLMTEPKMMIAVEALLKVSVNFPPTFD